MNERIVIREIPDDAGGRRPWLRPVDFATPRALAPDIEGRMRRLADDLSSALAARMNTDFALPAEIRPLWLHEGPWRELHAVPPDGTVGLVFESDRGGHELFSIDPTLASMLVERILGGDLDPARPLRALTTTDRALLRRFTEPVAEEVGQLWRAAASTEFTLTEVRPHRELGGLVDAAERALMCAFEVRVGSMYALLYAMMPLSAIRPMARELARPPSRAADQGGETERAVQERIARANLEVRAELPATRLSAREVAALQAGDRLALLARAGDPVALRADGVAVRWGHVGRSGGHRAVQVAEGAGAR